MSGGVYVHFLSNSTGCIIERDAQLAVFGQVGQIISNNAVSTSWMLLATTLRHLHILCCYKQ